MKVVEFLRVSTQEQSNEHRAGLPRQRQANLYTVEKYNLQVVKTITLIDVSGTSVLQTPEIQELTVFIQRKDIGGVVVADWDRLIRVDDFRDFALFEEFKETNTKVCLPDGIVDLNTQSGFLMTGLQSIIGGNELTQIKKRMLQAKEIKRKAGKHPNNDLSLPLGVGYDQKKECYYYTDEASEVKRLFDLFFYDGIHNFNELERLTGMHHRTIPNRLRNEMYKGYRNYTQKRSPVKCIKENGRQGDRKKIKRADDELIKVKVMEKPLIEDSVFDKVQSMLCNKRREYYSKRSAEGERFLFSGFIRCGDCGEKFYTTSGGRNPNRDYYYCRSKNSSFSRKNGRSKCSSSYHRKAVLEHSISSFVCEKLTNKRFLLKMVKVATSVNKNEVVKSKIGQVKRELDKIHRKRSKLVDLYTDDILSREELDIKISSLDRKKMALEVRHRELVETLGARDGISLEELVKAIVSTLTEFPHWEPMQKRAFLRRLIPEIWVTKQGITQFALNVSNDGIHTDMDS